MPTWRVLFAMAAVAACGEASETTNPSAQDHTLSVFRFSGHDPARPSLQVTGAQGQAQRFWTQDGQLTQALYVDMRHDVQVRLFFDGGGRLHRVQDERSGAFLIVEHGDASLAILVYDSSGQYLGGQVVFRRPEDGKHFVGPIAGAPPFLGQLRARLSGGPHAAEFVSWAVDGALVRGAAQEVPPKIVAYVRDPFSASSNPSSAGALQVASGSLLTPAESPGGEQASQGIVRSVVGAIAIFAGTQVGSIAAGTAVATFAPLLGVVAVTAGTYYVAQGLEDHREGIIALFHEASTGFAEGRTPAAVLNEIGKKITTNLRPALNPPLADFLHTLPLGEGSLLEYIETLVTPKPLPKVGASLQASLYDPGSSDAELTGAVAGSGRVTLTGETPRGRLDIVADLSEGGDLSGSFSGSLGNGTVVGKVESVPSSCVPPLVLMGRRCLDPAEICAALQVLDNRTCPNSPPVTCEPPQVLENGTCVDGPVTCEPPQVLDNGVCVNAPTSCEPPQVMENGVCVSPPDITCAPPYVLENGMCVGPPATCEPPQVLENGMCVTPTPAVSVNYIVVRRDISGFKIYSTATYPNLTQEGALEKAKANPGIWDIQLVSRQPGYGAMFCLAPDGGHDPQYFTSEGQLSSADAIVDARAQARAAGEGANPTLYVYICGTWVNR